MAGIILSIHIWASIFVFMGLVQSPWNIAEGLTKLYLKRTIVGAIINVVLNLLLIPIYSGIGAAIATVISYGFSSFVLNAFDVRTRKLFFIQAKALTLTNWTYQG
jgi:PST family polysaccharide transporter